MLASVQIPAQQAAFGQQLPNSRPSRSSAGPLVENNNANNQNKLSLHARRATDVQVEDRFAIPATRLNAEVRFDEDASEVINFVLTGGPKWGFRIRQLNDGRVIVSRVKKGPAEKCGLKVNDELLSVNNVPLSNQPRSLLLHDYPEELRQRANSGAPDKMPLLEAVQQQQQQDKENNRSPGDEEPAAALAPMLAGLAPPGHAIQLSKIDFAYQLIKHSSASNKLMLSVKRYMNPAYARASVAATNMSPGFMAANADVFFTRNDALQHHHHHYQQHNYQHDQQSSSLSRTMPTTASKRAHSIAGVHYAYKCCECYCDREGKSPVWHLLLLFITGFAFL